MGWLREAYPDHEGRFSIYDWKRKVEKAAAGEGPSPTSGPSPQTIEEQRDQEITAAFERRIAFVFRRSRLIELVEPRWPGQAL